MPRCEWHVIKFVKQAGAAAVSTQSAVVEEKNDSFYKRKKVNKTLFKPRIQEMVALVTK